MLTLRYPSILAEIQQMPVGILPIILEDKELPILIVKAPKEYILAAKLEKRLKVYIVNLCIENKSTLALVTAFFDDEDEPLIIKTPLFLEDFSATLFKLLKTYRVKVHFFDELSRERLIYSSDIRIPIEAQQKIDDVPLLNFSLPNAREMIINIDRWFGERTDLDDEQAITISLNESAYDEDILIQDTRLDLRSYHGARGFSHSTLEREEPGSYQEEDIIQCLLSVFPPEQIYLSPMRIYDNEEVCDILVATDTKVLLIQAKDSPNIERISRQKILRKRKNVIASLKKAIKQVKGAIGYYRRIEGRLEFFIKGERHSINTESLEVKTLIVVKELFSDQYAEYSPLVLDVFRGKNVPCIALDYPELYEYCYHLRDEDAFFNAYNIVMNHAAKHGEYNRLRFGLVDK